MIVASWRKRWYPSWFIVSWCWCWVVFPCQRGWFTSIHCSVCIQGTDAGGLL